uniref:Uncharacterized protein n=1 Tax=Oryza brachyantha TaxID=4533 RepID=J3LVV3_ORYBR
MEKKGAEINEVKHAGDVQAKAGAVNTPQRLEYLLFLFSNPTLTFKACPDTEYFSVQLKTVLTHPIALPMQTQE